MQYTSIQLHWTLFLLYRDGGLNLAEFAVLCRALFQNERDKPYHVEGKILKEMFEIFDIYQVSQF